MASEAARFASEHVNAIMKNRIGVEASVSGREVWSGKVSAIRAAVMEAYKMGALEAKGDHSK
jgi:hypothetical protein